MDPFKVLNRVALDESTVEWVQQQAAGQTITTTPEQEVH